MCSINPEVQKYADQIIAEIKSGKAITTELKGNHKLVINELEIPFNKRTPMFFVNLQKAVTKASDKINKNRKNYCGVLIVPEHLRSIENNSMVLTMASNMALLGINENTHTCMGYHYNFYPHSWNGKEVKKSDLPKIKIISFFKK